MIKIPIEALKDRGENDEEMMPEVGDEVSLGDAVGIFKGAEGDVAMLELKALAGVPVEYAEHKKEEPQPEEKEPDADDMLRLAKKADKDSGWED